MFWLLVFLFLPLTLIVGISVFSTGAYGEIERPLTLEHYRRFLGFGAAGWDPLYPLIFARSVWLAAVSTACCFALAVPLAFFIARLPDRWKTFALTLAVIPLWTNLLIRTYAWQIVLAPNGWLARAAVALSFSSDALYPGTFAVYLGMICDYLPFLVLPLYASVEKIDWTLAEAAQDLGAARWQVFRHAVLPQITPGMTAGLLLVFVPATGQFVIPDLLGGAKTVLLGNVIQQQFSSSRNWPFGAAIATVVMLLVAMALWSYARTARKREESIL
jgi:spermidine/putrescine transport system permease protein